MRNENDLLRELREFRLEFRFFRDQFLSTHRELWEQSRERWSGDENDNSLTWGSKWTGDSFIDQVNKVFTWSQETKIVEIGPGYGRLLDTILQRKYPFKSFTGIELSTARVNRLQEKYKAFSTISFMQGDVEEFSLSDKATLVISSATFPHLFPNFRKALVNIRKNMEIGGTLCFDLSEGSTGGTFQDDGTTYARMYDKDELNLIFSGSNYGNLNIDKVIHGKDGVTGESVKMLFVSVKRIR